MIRRLILHISRAFGKIQALGRLESCPFPWFRVEFQALNTCHTVKIAYGSLTLGARTKSSKSGSKKSAFARETRMRQPPDLSKRAQQVAKTRFGSCRSAGSKTMRFSLRNTYLRSEPRAERSLLTLGHQARRSQGRPS